MKMIMAHEKAVLLQFILDKGLPSWAKKHPEKVLAALCGKSERWAKNAYEQAHRAGYLAKL